MAIVGIVLALPIAMLSNEMIVCLPGLAILVGFIGFAIRGTIIELRRL